MTGLASLGYQYSLLLDQTFLKYCVSLVNIDDCWQISRIDGTIQPDPKHFPNGMKPLADYIHSKNLKFGLSSGLIYSLKIPH